MTDNGDGKFFELDSLGKMNKSLVVGSPVPVLLIICHYYRGLLLTHLGTYVFSVGVTTSLLFME